VVAAEGVNEGGPMKTPFPWLDIAFFVSGFAALLYQIVWQRVLFSVVGINIESVTVVVSAFLMGLGLGSVIGGAISRDPRRSPLLSFALIELAMGVFGSVSVPLFRSAGDRLLDLSPAVTAGATFSLVVAPTLLLGSTLPLLVASRVRRTGNVGQSVAMLYCVNTLGSAVAALLSVIVLLATLGLKGTSWLAAFLNLSVGVTALQLARREGRR
jgi:spermidine synthase